MADVLPLVLENGRVRVIASGDRLDSSALPPGGGGGGVQQVFVQQTRPTDPGPWTWWVTNASGAVVNLIVNDGA